MKKKIDVGKHVLVPKHSKLGEREKQELLKEYNITISELPKISKKDAAISELDVKPGDVIKIKRPSQTAGEALFYRVVING